jgi:transglutaminase-like putative cysteine protease
MEIRMHPRTEGPQRCLDHQVTTTPKTRMHHYRDFLGNDIYHCSVPGAHKNLSVVSEAVLEMQPWPELPESLDASAWGDLDQLIATGDYWEILLPSHFAKPTPRLLDLMKELDAVRRDDPLSLTREINTRLFDTFQYEPDATHVDSPIDDALRQRMGVCQDFAHIMIAVMRQLRVPCRYVSGYLHHRKQDQDRSTDGATHAWVETLMPGLGWVGFDPTNNLLARERHIRTAVGRDYADVPPTKGVFKGAAQTKLTVAVGVTACEELPQELAEMAMQMQEREEHVESMLAITPAASAGDHSQHQQQQQQQ